MQLKPKIIGLLSCSGEEFPGGTVSRIATRKVLQEMLPGMTAAICVPLFLAGDKQERDFVKNFPCITIDGCEKQCVKRYLDSAGIQPAKEITLTEFFTEEEYTEIKEGPLHDLKWKDHPYCQRLAEYIATKSIEILEKSE